MHMWLIKHRAIGRMGEWECLQMYEILTSVLDGSEWSASCHGHSYINNFTGSQIVFREYWQIREVKIGVPRKNSIKI
jgi:hypothetical protein